jgi:SPP1 family predicted phage head-tail adaptor
MNIGRLDRRIEIQNKMVSQNEFGESIDLFIKKFDSWAQVLPMRGSERFTSQQTVSQADTKFRIRWRPNIGTLSRIVYNEKEYDITAILEIGKREGLEIHARTRDD